MQEIKCNLWDFQHQGFPVVITTNCNTNSRGEAIMGKGIALEAKKHCPGLPKKLGEHIDRYYDAVKYFPEYNLYAFPTKYNWWEKSDIKLIERSTRQLLAIVDRQCYFYHEKPEKYKKIYMVRPGCSNGQLDWEDVKPILNQYLDERFFVVAI